MAEITRKNKWTQQESQRLHNELNHLEEDYKEFKDEMTSIANYFGFDKPAEMSELVDNLNKVTKQYNEDKLLITKLINQGGIVRKRDTDKLDSIMERIANRKKGRDQFLYRMQHPEENQ